MKKTLATVALAGFALGSVPVIAHATDDRPVKSGWVWLHPDGLVQGSCKEGYRPVYSEVPGFDTEAKFSVAYDEATKWKANYNLSYAYVRNLIDTGKLDPKNPLIWYYMFNNGYEKVVTTPEPGKLYEGDCILTTHEIPSGENNGKDDDVKPSPTPTPTPTETETTPSSSTSPEPTEPAPSPSTSPEPTPTPGTTSTPAPSQSPAPSPSQSSMISWPPSSPAPSNAPSTPPVVIAPPASPVPSKPPTSSAPVVKYVNRTFQVDAYRPKTRHQRAVVRSLAKDGVLKFREDRALWGANTYKIITVNVPVKTSDAKVLTLVATKAKLKASHVWELNNRASAKAPWGRKGNLDQRFIGRV